MDAEAFLRAELPEDVAVVVRESVGEVAELRVSLAGDMLPNADFGPVWFVMNDASVAVIRGGDERAPASLLAHRRLGEGTELSVVSGISSAVIELSVKGVRERLMQVSNARQRDFSEAARLINAWVKDGTWQPELLDSRRGVCAKCARPLPENMNVCPHCLDKGMMLRKVLAFLTPYKAHVALLFGLMVASTLFGLVNPYIGKVLVDDVLSPMKNAHWLPILGGLMILLYAAQNAIEMLTWRTSARIGTSTIYDVRAAMFHKLQELSLGFYSKHQAGGLITRVNQDTGQLQNLLVDFIPYGISSVLMAIGILGLLLHLSWLLTLLVLIPVTGIVLMVWKVFPRFRVYWERYFEKRSRLASFVENVINGVRVVKAFAQEGAEGQRFDSQNRAYRDAAFQAELKWATTMPILHMVAMLATPIVWIVGGWLAFQGKMTLGGIIAYTGYVTMLFRPVFILTRLAQLIPNTLAAAGRVFDIIDSEPEIADAPDAVAMPEIEGRIEFRGVTFGYDSHKPVLQDVSLEVEPREMIGLVGHSGAGKSTTINLVCRLFDVDSGQILIDGVDIRNIKYGDLRRHIGIVMQETFLLNGTVAENIAYGRPEAGVMDIVRAAKAANAHDFILGKPDGYDTQITQGGSNLSAGEKQRLAIARAIVCDPSILILDEATASVDLETEKQIQEAVERLVKERTTIAIAHRLSTLRNADRLVVIEKGKIAEVGTHKELSAKETGIYSRLVKLHQDTSGLRGVAG